MPEVGPTIYVGAEDDVDEQHRRLDDITKFYGVRYRDLVAGGFKLLSYAGQDMVLGITNREGRVQPTDLYHRLYREACAVRAKLIALDAASDIFIGNENERTEVRQLMGLFRHLAIDANCGVIVAFHPSLTGISSGSGLSGSTQWHNSVRARMYLKSPSEDDKEEVNKPDDGLRELQFMKNQYGRIASTIRLQWRDGLFLLAPSQSVLDKAAADLKVDSLFLGLLRRFAIQGRNVTDKKGTTYAPAIFAEELEAKEAKADKRSLADAMRRLFKDNKIEVVEYGPPSKRHSRLVVIEGVE